MAIPAEQVDAAREWLRVEQNRRAAAELPNAIAAELKEAREDTREGSPERKPGGSR